MTFIIAEAGVNHNGSIDSALKLIDAARVSGCNAIKFQTFSADKLTSENSQLADYQKKSIGNATSQREMLKELELSKEDFSRIKQYCDKSNIEFMSTPSSDEDLDFLLELGIRRIKIGSSDIDNKPLINRACQTGIPLIISTGMSTIGEVKRVVDYILSFISAGKLTLMQCTSEYPCPDDQLNLNVIDTYKRLFNVDIGFSDHSEGLLASVCAVAKGVVCLEKHFTLSRDHLGPDHKASLEPEMLTQYVDSIRTAEIFMGSNEKFVTPGEATNRLRMRKSLMLNDSGGYRIQRPALRGDDPWQWGNR